MILSATFAVAAFVKIDHFLIERDWHSLLPVMRADAAIAAVAAVETVIAIALLSRWRRAGGWAVIAVAILGNVAGGVFRGSVAGCGCLGRQPLSPTQHAALSLAIFVLGAFVVRGPAPNRDA